MTYIAEKYLHLSIFTYTCRDCFVGFFALPSLTASGQQDLKCVKITTKAS